MVKGYDNCMLKKYNITKLFNDFGERCCGRSTMILVKGVVVDLLLPNNVLTLLVYLA